MLRVVSWNVMYREYEEEYNPNSEILKKYVNEQLRIEQILIFIRENITPNTIICLQEVSNDLLWKLSEVLISSFNIFSANVENNNNVVTLAPKSFLQDDFCNSSSVSHAYVVINNGKTRIINCHLKPQRFAKGDVLEFVKNMKKVDTTTFIAGDFNELHKNVYKKLHDNFICPYYGKTYKKKAIDHIIFDLSDVTSYKVCKKPNDLSDHDMIILDI